MFCCFGLCDHEGDEELRADGRARTLGLHPTIRRPDVLRWLREAGKRLLATSGVSA